MKIVSVTGYLGYQNGSIGVATVDGPGSTWTNSGTVYVGSAGGGMLHITNGGQVGGGLGYMAMLPTLRER